MKRSIGPILLALLLIVLSGAFYSLHYVIFRDAHHIFIYLLGDIAFVFIEVLLVSLIIHRLLEHRERSSRMEKLNMVIGAFFSEVGMQLIRLLSKCDPQIEQIQRELATEVGEPIGKFRLVCDRLRSHEYALDCDRLSWDDLKSLLVGKRAFLLRLMENPNLLEHESFTEVLWAVFHLDEELEARADIHGLSQTDRKHLGGDANRAYRQVALQWLKYMKHLESSYPYLFSLSVRMNPFDRDATPVVQAS